MIMREQKLITFKGNSITVEQKNKTTKKERWVCPICDAIIKEAANRRLGQDAVACVHLGCTGNALY